jgi:hypothetical protein
MCLRKPLSNRAIRRSGATPSGNKTLNLPTHRAAGGAEPHQARPPARHDSVEHESRRRPRTSCDGSLCRLCTKLDPMLGRAADGISALPNRRRVSRSVWCSLSWQQDVTVHGAVICAHPMQCSIRSPHAYLLRRSLDCAVIGPIERSVVAVVRRDATSAVQHGALRRTSSFAGRPHDGERRRTISPPSSRSALPRSDSTHLYERGTLS